MFSTETNEKVNIRIEFNSLRISQRNQHGRRDVAHQRPGAWGTTAETWSENQELLSIFSLEETISFKAWQNDRNISTQHLTTLLHDVATCGQQHATFSTQHVDAYVPQAPGAQPVNLARMS